MVNGEKFRGLLVYNAEASEKFYLYFIISFKKEFKKYMLMHYESFVLENIPFVKQNRRFEDTLALRDSD